MLTKENKETILELINIEIKKQSDREVEYWRKQYRNLLKEIEHLGVISKDREEELIEQGEKCTVYSISNCVERYRNRFQEWIEEKESPKKQEVYKHFQEAGQNIGKDLEKWQSWSKKTVKEDTKFKSGKSATGVLKGGEVKNGMYKQRKRRE